MTSDRRSNNNSIKPLKPNSTNLQHSFATNWLVEKLAEA
jgi:hypothetical protein